MDDAKHTPGPWRLEEHLSDIEGSDVRHGYTEIHAGDGQEYNADVGAVVYCTAGLRCSEERAANARLIAAAPDLLDALNDVPLPSTQGGWGEFVPRFYDWLKKRDAAIAKAEGRDD